MGKKEPRVIRVFIASPGDLAEERRAFKQTIDDLNKGFGRGANVTFEPLGWEDALSQVGRRSQSVINQDVDICDVFVLAMWRRWGQDAPDAAPLSSYTEEEFYRALARWEKTSSPEIFVFFKQIDLGHMADPGPQLKKVLEFRKELEATRKTIHRPFGDINTFQAEIDRHLVAFARGEVSSTNAVDRCLPVLPESIKRELEKQLAEIEIIRAKAKQVEADTQETLVQAKDEAARAKAAAAAAEAKAESKALALAEHAAKAAMDGKIEEARQDFAKALDGSTNLAVLNLGSYFFNRIGEFKEAENLLRQWLALSGPDAQTEDAAIAFGNLGVILKNRGELSEAESMLFRALAINEKLNLYDGMANQYGNLGTIKQVHGKLDEAEALYHKALDLHEKTGNQVGMSIAFSNLGVILKTRGDLNEAESMYRKAMEIDEKLGRQEGLASLYGNLGIIMKTRGDLDQAEILYHKALEIEEKIGRRGSIAAQYGNLGTIRELRRDLDGAEAMYLKALDIFVKINQHEGMTITYGNLGDIKRARGDLDGAESMYRKALEVAKSLGPNDSVCRQYANLGALMHSRNRLDGARVFWTKARDLFAELGATQMAKRMQEWIDALK